MRDRPTIDVVVLLFAVTVCGFLLLAGAGLTVLAIVRPEGAADRASYGEALVGAVTTILGALLGLVAAGRAGRPAHQGTPPTHTTDPT